MPAIKQFLRRYALLLAALLLGSYSMASAVWELGKTAFYIHHAVVLPGTVTDVRQRPFESHTEAWFYGNMCPADATAYQPFVSFTLPAGITINKTMPDLDCDDYALNQTVEIITPPHDPNQAHVYKAKFLCGWSLMKLGAGIILFLPSFIILRKRSKHKQKQRKAPTNTQPSGSTPPPRSRKAREEDDFTLESPEPAPAKKRRTRKTNSTEGEKKRTSKRKKSTSGTTRRSKSTPKE